MADSNHLLTAREAVAFLGISLSTLRKIEQDGGLTPFRTPGGHRRYDLDMLRAYLEKTRKRAEAKNAKRRRRRASKSKAAM